MIVELKIGIILIVTAILSFCIYERCLSGVVAELPVIADDAEDGDGWI